MLVRTYFVMFRTLVVAIETINWIKISSNNRFIVDIQIQILHRSHTKKKGFVKYDDDTQMMMMMVGLWRKWRDVCSLFDVSRGVLVSLRFY